MPTVITQGAASAKGYGFGARATAANYIEDVFSTYLYTGNGGTQTITNGIDLSGKGGLVWVKARNIATANSLVDTVRGAGKPIYSNSATTQQNYSGFSVSSFNSTGFAVTDNAFGDYSVNDSSKTYVSWTFRKQPKFFDIVTYTGTGANRTIAHNLGSVPGCIIVKRTNSTSDWTVYHRSLANTEYMILNTTAGVGTAAYWNSTTPTSSVFSLGTSTVVNASGGTYVAYLFAHDAGGFGATGTDNVISCGSLTTDGSALATVNLGYEPQWLLVKSTGATASNWTIVDVMRGFSLPSANSQILRASAADAESAAAFCNLSSTGFTAAGLSASTTYIYIAIRRGPMKTPTVGTSVFSPVAYTGTGANDRQIGASTFVVDYILETKRNTIDGKYFYTRLQGNGAYLNSTNTNAEAGAGSTLYGPQYGKIQLGYQQGSNDGLNLDNSGDTFINYLFRRAPGFFDVVCYSATNSGAFRSHNLGVVPELIIDKRRDATGTNDVWYTWHISFGITKNLQLNSTSATTTSPVFITGGSELPTATTFLTESQVASTRVAYLFASCPGVSKVGSYTGTGTTKQIDCGFTGGARFVLIKRTDSTGDWYVWDSARGIVAGNDPFLRLNSTAPAAINANGGTFIFLAIA